MLRTASLHRLCVALLVTLTLFASSRSEAGRISQVKDNQVMIDLEGSDLALREGEKYLVLIDGKRKAIVQVTKVKGKKAIGRVTKGKAAVDGTLVSANGAQASSSGKKRSRSTSEEGFFSELSYGFLLGYGLDTQDITSTNAQTGVTTNISMSGSGFSAKGFADLPISGPLGIIGRGGIEQFNVKGSSNLVSYKTEIMYASLDLLMRINIMEGTFVPFAAAGIGLHFPVSKSSDVLNVQQITATSVFLGALGANFNLSPSMYITALGEYGYFPPSNEVKTNFIAVRTGMGFKF